MDSSQSPTVIIERQSVVSAKVKSTIEGVVVVFGDDVWVCNFLMQPDEAEAFFSYGHQAAIQVRAMRAGK